MNKPLIYVREADYARLNELQYGDGGDAKLGLVFRDSSDCTITGNQLHGLGDQPAAIVLSRCVVPGLPETNTRSSSFTDSFAHFR